MLVLVAVGMVVFFVAAVFSVDIAYMLMAREQLQIATDAAAKAAVVALAAGSNSTQATNTAISYAGMNQVGSGSLTITSSNVTLGRVSYVQGQPWTFNASGTPKIAARVTGSVSVPLFFAKILGVANFSPSNTSTAAFVRNKWCLVLDRSGSMTWDMTGTDFHYSDLGVYSGWYNGFPGKWPSSPYYLTSTSRFAWLCTAANTFLTTLTNSPGGTATNQVGLVTFGASASSDCTFSSNYTAVSGTLSNYRNADIWSSGIADSSTNMTDGLQHALDMFNSTDDGTPWNKIIILFSDGIANEGYDPVTGQAFDSHTSPQTMTPMVTQIKNKGIVIYSIGLLQSSNNTIMTQLPSLTGGTFQYANSGQALQDAFTALAQTIPVILTQ